MDKKKTKRPKSKTQSDGHRHGRSTVKKKRAEVTAEKEEQERLEAANILSSLKFMAPIPSDGPATAASVENAVKSGDRKVTYLPTSTIGISTSSTPSLNHQGKQPMIGGSFGAHSVISQAVLQQLSNLQANMPSLLSILKMQPVSLAQTQTSDSKVPSVVKNAEPSRLPLTLNPVKTVNKTVATALRQAVVQNTGVKQGQDSLEMNSMLVETPEKRNDDKPLSPVDSDKMINIHPNDDKTNSPSRKKDSLESALPLKKRRLVSLLDPLSSDLGTNRLSDLASAVQMNNILSLARDYPNPPSQQEPRAAPQTTESSQPTEGYRPVKFDPRTSLLVLSDLKAALTPDEEGDLPIHIAVVHENTELVKKFIDIMAVSGKSVDRYNKLQQTPLHLAVLVNKPDIVQALLEAGADPNLVDRNGCTSTHIAITKRFFTCLQTIFSDSRKRVEVNTRNYEGYSPLHTVVELGDFPPMQFLNERGAPGYINLNIQDGKAGRSVLFYATEYKHAHMVEYLINCGVNVDLQNYAGVTALMTAQAGGFEDITLLLTQALESQKLLDDGYTSQPKKIPIAPIPSKAKLIIQDSPLFRSRSNSLSLDVKPAPVSRTSSTSSSSPMDLSLARQNKSPSHDISLRQKPNSFYTEPMHNGSSFEPGSSNEADRLASKGIKERHAQIIAALQGHNLLSRPCSLVPSSLYNHHGLEDFLVANEVKIKEEPKDLDEIDSQSQGKSDIQEMDIGDALVRKENTCTEVDKSYSEMDVVTQDTSVPDVLEPISTELDIIRYGKGDSDSPKMPLLSRATSLTEKPQGTNNVSQSPNSLDGSVENKTINFKKHYPLLVDSEDSPRPLKNFPDSRKSVLSNSDNSNEAMDVDADVEIIPDAIEPEMLEERNRTTVDKRVDIDDDSNDMEEIDMDVNAIEEDAEHEDDDEGLLIIDENVTSEKNQSKCDSFSNDSSKSEEDAIQRVGSTSLLHTEKSNSALDNNLISNISETARDGNVNKMALPSTNVPTKDTLLDRMDADKEKHNEIASQHYGNILDKSRQILIETDDDSIEVEQPLSLSSEHVTDGCSKGKPEPNGRTITSRTNNHSPGIPSLKEKFNTLHSNHNFDSNKRNSEQNSSSFKELGFGENECGKGSSPGKTINKDAPITTGHSRTLYVREGDSYKPIKIFIDDTVQSSIVLQQMLGQSSVVPSITSAETMQLVNNDNKHGRPVNSSVLSKRTSTTTSASSTDIPCADNVTMDGQPHTNTTTNISNHVPNVGDGGVGVSSSNHIQTLPDFRGKSVPSGNNSMISTPTSAQLDAMMKLIGKRTVLSSETKDSAGTTEGWASSPKTVRVSDKPSSIAVHSGKDFRTMTTYDKTRDASSTEIDRNKVKKPNESYKGSKAEKDLVNHSQKAAGIARAYSPVISSVSSQKAVTSSIPSAATSRKVSYTAPQQTKVANFLQNRIAVSTSEGTLTWVNPDIKSRLSKALQSPQRKSGGKTTGAGPEVDSNQQSIRSTGANALDDHFETAVHTAMVSDTRQ